MNDYNLYLQTPFGASFLGSVDELSAGPLVSSLDRPHFEYSTKRITSVRVDISNRVMFSNSEEVTGGTITIDISFGGQFKNSTEEVSANSPPASSVDRSD